MASRLPVLDQEHRQRTAEPLARVGQQAVRDAGEEGEFGRKIGAYCLLQLSINSMVQRRAGEKVLSANLH